MWQINRCASSYRNKTKGRHKICIHRREEGNPERNFQGDKTYLGEPSLILLTKELEVNILQMLRKNKINRKLEKYYFV